MSQDKDSLTCIVNYHLDATSKPVLVSHRYFVVIQIGVLSIVINSEKDAESLRMIALEARQKIREVKADEEKTRDRVRGSDF